MKYFKVAIFALLLTTVCGFIQKITIYELPDKVGEAHTFMRKHSNLDNWKFFLNNTGSSCTSGVWDFFDGENYEYNGLYFGRTSDTEHCENRNFSGFSSARFMGPIDTDTPALALYQGSGLLTYGGNELVIENAAARNFTHHPKFVASFGNSAWTLFGGNNYDGEYHCLAAANTSLGYRSWVVNATFEVRSVIRGCNLDPMEIQKYRGMVM